LLNMRFFQNRLPDFEGLLSCCSNATLI